MKEIDLTQGYKTVVNDEDYKWLSRYKWRIDLPFLTVARGSPSVLMSRQIMEAPAHLVVDHINGDRLNNQRFNLRLCTQAQNMMNQKPQQGCSSIYKGVSWRADISKWYSYIKFEQHTYRLGHYKDERQAAFFYDIAAVHFFGEFARLNFPEDIEFIKNYWKEKEEVRADVH